MYNYKQQEISAETLQNIQTELTSKDSFISVFESLPYITFAITPTSQVVAYNRQCGYAVSRDEVHIKSFESTGEFIKCVHRSKYCGSSGSCIDCPLINSMEASISLSTTVVHKDVLLYLTEIDESMMSFRCTLISTPFMITDTRLILITLLDSEREESKNVLEEQFARELLQSLEVAEDLAEDFAASITRHIEAIHESIQSY